MPSMIQTQSFFIVCVLNIKHLNKISHVTRCFGFFESFIFILFVYISLISSVYVTAGSKTKICLSLFLHASEEWCLEWNTDKGIAKNYLLCISMYILVHSMLRFAHVYFVCCFMCFYQRETLIYNRVAMYQNVKRGQY